MNIYNRIMEGIRTYGLKNTVQVSFISLLDYLFDFRYGTDTVSQVELEDLSIQSDNRTRGERYAVSPARAFNKLLHALDLPRSSVFVDLGCGKGKMLLLASLYGFKRVVGLEFSKELYECAKRNISVFRTKTGLDDNISVVHSDVVEYEIKEDENVFYLFNPFDDVVLSKVLQNINISCQKNPRTIYLLYYTPYHDNVIEKDGHFSRSGQYSFNGCKFNVYVNNPVLNPA